MQSTFPEFYRISDENFRKMWDECIFVFDANVLLHLYMYSQATSDDFLKILNDPKIRERVWMPHQFASEYQKRRLRVISDQKNSYEKLTEDIYNLIKKFEKHPFLKMNDVMGSAIKQIREAKQKHPKWNVSDPIRQSLTNLFENRVGKPFSKVELEALYKEGQTRFQKKIPPGYLDQGKDDKSRFGDFIGWQQILNYSKETRKPIFFITDEKHEDWWWKINNEFVGARHELAKEMRDFSEMFFCMYNSRNFHRQAARYLKRKVNQSAAKEITEVTAEIKKDPENVSPTNAPTTTISEFGTGEKLAEGSFDEPQENE